MTRAWGKEKFWVPHRNKSHARGGGRTPDGRSIHWATRTHREQDHAFNWVDMLQASCTLLGSALSKSSWVWQMNKMVFFLITLLSIRKQSHIFESKKSIQRLNLFSNSTKAFTIASFTVVISSAMLCEYKLTYIWPDSLIAAKLLFHGLWRQLL